MKPLRVSVFVSTPLFAILGRAGGMIIPFFVAFLYGVTRETDAFFFSYAFILFAGGLTQQVFESALVPYLAEQKKIRTGLAAEMASRVAWTILPFVGSMALLIGLGMGFVLSKISGLSAQTASVAVRLYFEMIPFLLLAIPSSAVNGVFNTHKIFWYPAFSPLLRSLVVIACLFLFHKNLGIHAVSLGFCVGEAVRWGVSQIILSRHGLSERDGEGKTKAELKANFWSETGFQILALAAAQLVPLVNQWFSTWMGTGEVTLLSYADRLMMIPSQIFIAGISQIYLSRWADAFLEQSVENFRIRVVHDTKLVCFVSLSVSVMLWLLRDPIVSIAYSRGNFAPEYAPRVAEVFGWFVLGFAPTVFNSLCLRVLFILRKPIAFCVQSWGKIVLQVLLALWMTPHFGIGGVAMATSISMLLAGYFTWAYVGKVWRVSPGGSS